MKTSIVIKEGRTQLVMSPESDHDKDVIKILSRLPNTHLTDFFDTQGGFARFSEGGHHEDLLIVLDAQPSPKEESK